MPKRKTKQNKVQRIAFSNNSREDGTNERFYSQLSGQSRITAMEKHSFKCHRIQQRNELRNFSNITDGKLLVCVIINLRLKDKVESGVIIFYVICYIVCVICSNKVEITELKLTEERK